MLGNVAKASAFVGSATAFTLLCSWVAFGFNARALGIDDLGQLALVQAAVSFVGGLTTFDNWQPIVRFGIRSSHRLGLVLGCGLALDVLASVLAAFIAGVSILCLSISLGFDWIFGWALVPYWLSLLTGLSGTPKGYFRLTGRFDLLAYSQVFNSVLQLGAAMLLWYYQASFEMYLVVLGSTNFLASLPVFLAMLIVLRQKSVRIANPLREHSTRRFLRIFIGVAAGNSVLSTLTTSRYQLVLFVMSGVSGTTAVGLFAAASRCAGVLTRCIVPVSQIFFPEILHFVRREGSAEVRQMMGRITLLAGGCALILIAAGVLGSRSLMVLVAGPEFVDAASALTLLVAAEALIWASFHFNAFILGTVGQVPLLKANLTITVATVIAALVLSHTLGQVGGGLAVLFGSMCSYIALTLIARSQIVRLTATHKEKAD